MISLKEALKNWMDVDVAQYRLAKCLGVIDAHATFQETKYLWWTNSDIGSIIYNLLESMKDEGLLEYRDESGDYQFRWARDDLEDYINERYKSKM